MGKQRPDGSVRDPPPRPAGATSASAIAAVSARPLAGLLRSLDAAEAGLSAAAAAAKLATIGPNRIETAARRRLWSAFLARFRNPLILVLLGAAAVSAFTGDVPSFVVITLIVSMSIVLDVVQEHRAQNAAERLQAQVSLSATVLRDGRPEQIPAVNIVPGDVILLVAGDLIPADCRLIEARDLYLDEALLTGEPYPSEKQASPAAAAPEQDAFPENLLFTGSSVVSGTAKALVVTTGRDTQLSAIAQSLQKAPPPTAFANGIRDFGMMIVRLTVLLVLFALLVNLLFHRPVLESFLFALAARLEATTLFCRVTPAQKSRVIRALRCKGHIVGYLGDGINDAPSLHAADIGFSVDTAVDVAKEAACMILLRKDLGVLAEGVREGRRPAERRVSSMAPIVAPPLMPTFSFSTGGFAARRGSCGAVARCAPGGCRPHAWHSRSAPTTRSSRSTPVQSRTMRWAQSD